MKGFVILGVLLSGFYFGALHIVSSQLKDMANFYENLDQTTSAIANNQTPQTPFKTQDIKAIIDAYTSIF